MIKGIGAAAGAASGAALLGAGAAAASEWTQSVVADGFRVVTAEQTGHSIQVVVANESDSYGVLDVTLLDAAGAVVEEQTTQIPVGRDELFYFDGLPDVYEIDLGGQRRIVGFDPVRTDRDDYETFVPDPYVLTVPPSTRPGETDFRTYVTHGASTFDAVEVGFEYREHGSSGSWQSATIVDPSFEVENSVTVTDLDEDQAYELRAVLSTGGTREVIGDSVTFTHQPDTGSGWF